MNGPTATAPARVHRGRTAEILEWGPDRVVKLFFADFPQRAVLSEANKILVARAADLPVPAVEGFMWETHRTGLILERVRGRAMLTMLLEDPGQVEALARIFARLHARMHRHTHARLPSLKRHIRACIENTAELDAKPKAMALAGLESLDEGSILCHGDFHPGNVLMVREQPWVIDWYDALGGEPAADVARTVTLLKVWRPPVVIGAQAAEAIDKVRSVFLAAYLRDYLLDSGMSFNKIRRWLLPAAAALYVNQWSEGERASLLQWISMLADQKVEEPSDVL